MPRELPLYQFTVSCICKLFDLRIEFCSRIVSISFFYASVCLFIESTKIHHENYPNYLANTIFPKSGILVLVSHMYDRKYGFILFVIVYITSFKMGSQ